MPRPSSKPSCCWLGGRRFGTIPTASPAPLLTHHSTDPEIGALNAPIACPGPAGHQRTSGGSRGSLTHPLGIRGAVDFPRGEMPLPKPIKYFSNHQASLENSRENSAGKFVSLVELPGTLRSCLKCRTKSFAMQKEERNNKGGEGSPQKEPEQRLCYCIPRDRCVKN